MAQTLVGLNTKGLMVENKHATATEQATVQFSVWKHAVGTSSLRPVRKQRMLCPSEAGSSDSVQTLDGWSLFGWNAGHMHPATPPQVLPRPEH